MLREYKQLVIRPPSRDTCGECFQYSQALSVLTRRRNDRNRMERRQEIDNEDWNEGDGDLVQNVEAYEEEENVLLSGKGSN